jgi:FtsH-binding integral membrane protein
MMAVCITLVVSLGITLLSLQTKYDFTSCFHYMLMVTLLITFISSGIVIATSGIIIETIFPAIYAAIGAVFVVLCVTIDVQMLISGNRKIKVTTTDYVYVCFQLYIDLFYFLFFSCEKNEY